MTIGEVLELARESDFRLVDVRFIDLMGAWQHFVMPARQLTADFFEKGRYFEGAGPKGWAFPGGAGMRIVPDPATAMADPFARVKTLSLVGSVHDQAGGGPLTRDPRTILRRALDAAGRALDGAKVRVGAEMDFYVFDEVRYDQTRNSAYFYVDSDEGRISAAREEGGQQAKSGREPYYTMPDGYFELRHDLLDGLLELGLAVSIEHREGHGAGQATVYLSPTDPLTQADNIMWVKYAVKNIALRNGKVATFMPRPLADESPSGLNLLWTMEKNGADLFPEVPGAAGANAGRSFAGGILKHSAALCAFTNPTLNSYRRLAPGADSPVNIMVSSVNRSAALAFGVLPDGSAGALRLRLPDPAMNPYLGFAALLSAGVDGLKTESDPGPDVDKDLSLLSQEELADVPVAPASLEEALAALEVDGAFLYAGGVFDEEVAALWVELKMETEVSSARARPTPHEYALYFDT